MDTSSNVNSDAMKDGNNCNDDASSSSRKGRPSIQCRYFMNNGFCFYGDHCQFVHCSARVSNGDSGVDRHLSVDEEVGYFTPNSSAAMSSSTSSSVVNISLDSMPGSISSELQGPIRNPQQSEKQHNLILQQQFRRMRLQQNLDNNQFQQSHDLHQLQCQQQNQQQKQYHSNTPAVNSLQLLGPKADKTSYFISQQMRMELQKQRVLQLTEPKDQGLPRHIDNYHSVCPLEDLKTTGQSQMLLGHPSSCYKVTNSKDGLQYCVRRIHGFRVLNPKAVSAVEQWKQIQNTNIVQLMEAFTTKAFGDTSLVFIYNYYAGAETLMARHFKGIGPRSPPGDIAANYMQWGHNNMSQANKVKQKVIPERLIWSYIIQLTAAIRQIHSLGLACRIIDPSKVLLIGNSRLRLNCAGILDILTSDSESASPAMLSHHQQEDLVALGKLILALSCYSIDAVLRENMHQSLEFLARSYSNDLKTLVLHLLSSQVTSNAHSINEVMPVIGARFYSQLDSTQGKSDLLETELSKEMENGRLMRLLAKLCSILERSDFNMDPEWSETGDRYLLKLFRDYMFHQVTETGAAWIDFAHIIVCLNKLDAGSSERVCLTSRDEQSILVVSYHDLKACMESAFSELLQTNVPSSNQ